MTEFKIVPAGTRDIYAAGLDGNSFETREEAELAIAELRSLGGSWDTEWDIIRVSAGEGAR